MVAAEAEGDSKVKDELKVALRAGFEFGVWP
jgi:hypothetical protein